MDAIADDLDIQVGQNDITERLVLMSRQYGIEPQQLIQLLQQNNQLPAMFADVRRGLTVAAVVEAATVTDTDGNVIDTSEFFGSAETEDDLAEALAAAAEVDEDDDTRRCRRGRRRRRRRRRRRGRGRRGRRRQVTPRRPGEIKPRAKAHVLASARRRGLASVGDNTHEKAGNPS